MNNMVSCLSLLAVAILCLENLPCDAFVPSLVDRSRRHFSSQVVSQSPAPFPIQAFTTEVLEPTIPEIPKVTEDILDAQQRAEQMARNRHDVFAMNALFVNVPEHPDPTPCIVSQGPLPKDLPAGCLMRIGPNGATKEDGWLDGDGLIQCVVIPPADKASSSWSPSPPIFSSTYVKTRGRSLEHQSSGRVDGGKRFRGTLGAAPNGLPMLQNLMKNGLDFQTMVVQKDTCNTALAVSGDRVLALMEQSPPSEIQISKDGRLRTVANMCRLDGAVVDAPITGGSFGAHGRTDPRTGERVHVSYSSATKPFVRVDTFAENWNLISSVGVDVPAPVMIHDCAITDQYVVLLDFPLTVRPSRFLRDAFPVEYEPTNGARIGLAKRRQTSRVRNDSQPQWFTVEAGVVLHVANAFERSDGKVVVHGFKSLPKGESSYILDYTPAFLHQWILDPATGNVVEDRCLNPNELVEFPIVEDRFVGSNPGCIYGLQATSIGGPLYECKTPHAGVLLNSVIKFSTNEGSAGDVVSRYDLEPGWHFCSEPTVVTKTSQKGHYVLLYTTFVPENDARDKSYDEMARDGSSLRSRLLVLDGDDISSGPRSIVDLPYHMNYGLHSLYLPWDKLT